MNGINLLEKVQRIVPSNRNDAITKATISTWSIISDLWPRYKHYAIFTFIYRRFKTVMVKPVIVKFKLVCLNIVSF